MINFICRMLVKFCKARGKVFYIRGGDEGATVYLVRYIVFKSKYCCMYIHRFMRSDSDVPHDHPWNFFTYVISGGYKELFYEKKAEVGYKDDLGNGKTPATEFKSLWRPRWIERLPGSIAYRRATDVHQVVVDKNRNMDEIDEAPFTVCLIGPRIREWGFWADSSTWIDWRKYLNISPNDARIEGAE